MRQIWKSWPVWLGTLFLLAVIAVNGRPSVFTDTDDYYDQGRTVVQDIEDPRVIFLHGSAQLGGDIPLLCPPPGVIRYVVCTKCSTPIMCSIPSSLDFCALCKKSRH